MLPSSDHAGVDGTLRRRGDGRYRDFFAGLVDLG